MGWLKIQKLDYLGNRTWFIYEIKKFLTCASDDTFWEVIVFLVEVTFKAERVEHCIDASSLCLGSWVQTSPTCLPALGCYMELLDKLQKWLCSAVGPSLSASLEPLAHHQNVASLSHFYSY